MIAQHRGPWSGSAAEVGGANQSHYRAGASESGLAFPGNAV